VNDIVNVVRGFMLTCYIFKSEFFCVDYVVSYKIGTSMEMQKDMDDLFPIQIFSFLQEVNFRWDFSIQLSSTYS
jgi:hypothetical protein